MFMSAEEFRESLRALNPRVFVNGRQVESVADDDQLAPGVNAVGVTYDFALNRDYHGVARARQHTSGQEVNRFLHINTGSADLMAKLEYTRAVCQETGCAMRYLTMDGFNALFQATHRIDADTGSDYHPRFLAYLHRAQERDLTVGIAMTVTVVALGRGGDGRELAAVAGVGVALVRERGQGHELGEDNGAQRHATAGLVALAKELIEVGEGRPLRGCRCRR